jgi:HEAT repeat protein
MSKIAYLIAKEDWDAIIELKATEPLMKMLDNLDKSEDRWFDDRTYPDAIFALGKIGDAKAVDFLIKYLKIGLNRWPSGGDEIRASAARALGGKLPDEYGRVFGIGDIRAIQPLIEAISDEVDEVRENVATALGAFGEKAVGPLAKLLDKGVITSMPKEDFDETGDWQWDDIRLNTIEALIYTNSKLAVEPLIKILKDDGPFTVYNEKGKKLKVCDNDWKGRALAAKKLGEFGDVRAVEALIGVLSDNEVCASAARVLGEIGDKRALEPLREALKSTDNDMRLEAACSLGLMDDPNGINILITEYKASEKKERKKIKNMLKKISPKKVGAELENLELLDDAEEWYTSAGILDKAAEMRKKKADMGAAKVSQKIVQGDEITKTEIKDSVLNRSNIGGGSSKMQDLKDLTEMKKEGIIDDDEFKQMKKEILGR